MLIECLFLSLVLAAAPQGTVVPVKLSRPAYPTIALSARVTGDVEVLVHIRPDGGVKSATVTSGTALLSGAALEAARSSQFECRGCIEASTAYSLLFSFRLDVTIDSVPAAENRVTIVAETPIVGGVVWSYFSARSAKCLWLWRCGRRWPGGR